MSEPEQVITMDVDLELESLPAPDATEEIVTPIPKADQSTEAAEEEDPLKWGPQVRSEAVHLHGVDDMSTKDIEAYFSEYEPKKIEWVNDTSCNAVFESDEKALQAIQGLLLEPDNEINHTVLRKSKVYTMESGTTVNNLHIRLASDQDVKEKGARERSRYYLLHGGPSKDINERLGRRREKQHVSNNSSKDVLSRLGGYREPGSRSRRHRKY